MSSGDRSVEDSWPAVGAERLEWRFPAGWPTVGLESPVQPYTAAVPPLIAGLTPSVSPETGTLAEAASAALQRFDAEMGHRLRHFAPVLLRSEAASSSQIENLTASARSVFSAELGLTRNRNASDIAANTAAMETALSLAERLTTESVRSMHAVLLAAQPRHTPGVWRSEPVWIGVRSDSPLGAEYVAPAQARVPGLMEDLSAFAGRGEIPAVVSAAVAHAQFETIHPFSDGNGRVGRAFLQSMLRSRGVTRTVAVPVSAGLLVDVEGYHAALSAYRDGDVDPIVRAVSVAGLRGVESARVLVGELETIRLGWEARLTARRHSNAWKLLDVFLARPVLTAKVAAQELGLASATNVYPPLKALVDAGIIQSKSEYQRGPFYRSDEVLEAIDRFAERAGRRQRS